MLVGKDDVGGTIEVVLLLVVVVDVGVSGLVTDVEEEDAIVSIGCNGFITPPPRDTFCCGSCMVDDWSFSSMQDVSS